MRALLFLFFAATIVSAPVVAQESASAIQDPAAFRRSVDVGITLADLAAAVDDPDRLQALAERVLILDGVAASITVYSTDPADFYVELELVGGAWDGVEEVEIFSAFVILDDPAFSDRVAERVPRDPPERLILRNDRVLVAARLVSVAEVGAGNVVPVLQAYDIRPLR